ncbi:MAG: EAL domain-containing protein [Gammaproteobacteria bacterium]|nr:EAL domain-containing protein [Gammaproteobacteria bacterium]
MNLFKPNLALRMVLVIVGIEIIMLSLLVWNSVRLISSSHAELFERTVTEETFLLADSLATGLTFRDRAILKDVLFLLKDKENLVYAQVTDRTDAISATIGNPPHNALPDTSYKQALKDGIYDVEHRVELGNQFLGTLKAGFSIEEVEKLTNETRLQNATIALLMLVLSILVTVATGVYLMRRFDILNAGALALKSGNLEHRIPVKTNDEIGDLADTFNQLAEHLENTQAELQKEHQALEEKTRHLHTLLNGVNAVIFEANARNIGFRFVSNEAACLLKYPIDAWYEDKFWMNQIYEEDLDRVYSQWLECAQPAGRCTQDYRVFDSEGELLWIRHIANFEENSDGVLIARGLLIDITEEKHNADHISYLATHDSLTGLINRHQFFQEIKTQVQMANRYGHQSALLFIDLDQFKYINDTFGHFAGDECLIQVAKTLHASIRMSDILCRLGGDEFAIILPIVKHGEAEEFAHLLLQRLNEKKITYSGHHSYISASIGIVLFPLHGKNPDDLLAKADLAMYNAKNLGRNRYFSYRDDSGEDNFMEKKIHWATEIKSALSEDRFRLHYQPIIDLQTDSLSHYEVLLRMLDRNGNIIEPSDFIDVAERFGLIYDIDKWVIENAIRMQNYLNIAGHSPAFAINLSGFFFGSEECLRYVRKQIELYRIDPTKLIFEVTETVALRDLEKATTFIDSLRKLGCRFALDDFGVGFASFQYLKNLTIDYIKIDGHFIRDLHIEPQDLVFVKAILTVAQSLGIETIAEFVDNHLITAKLKDIGVEKGQGYHWSPPRELHEFYDASFFSYADKRISTAKPKNLLMVD